MGTIKNVTIEFNCQEKLNGNFFCNKCSRSIVDFTNKNDKELIEEIEKSKGTVCGQFKTSQLSDQFLKYAAATFIATSLTVPSIGQAIIKGDSHLKACEKLEQEGDEDVFIGVIIETQAEPVGGYKEFYNAVAREMKYPSGLKERGKVFIEFTIDSVGKMNDLKVIKGFNELADKEAIRLFSTLNYPFNPGRQRGKPVKTRLIIPILFDINYSEKK